MNKLIHIAQEVIKRGDEFIATHGPSHFHQYAQRLLEEARLHQAFSFDEIVAASFSPDFKHQQNYGPLQFSDLALTLAMGEHCFLDLYFWRRRPTTIHNHHFTGAFQCLAGINVDLEFEYSSVKSLGQYHDLGEVKLKQSRTLNPGDIAPIDFLDKFIHQNHHQAELTINACLRTPDIGEVNLSNYLYSGLRFEQYPHLLERGSRLLGFINMGGVDVSSLNLTPDDAIHFLLKTYKSASTNRSFLEIRSYMKELVAANIDHLMDEHERRMDEIENHYY